MKVYETKLTVNLLDVNRGDSGDYMIRLDITSLPFTTGTTVSLTRSIVVLGIMIPPFLKNVDYLL